MLSWTEWLTPKGVLKSGARDLLWANILAPASAELLAEVFESAALESLLAAHDSGCPALLRWWRARLAGEFRKRSEFPIEAALRLGKTSLIEDPKVIVGTVHSVKGGQADVVYVFPDLSRAADAEYQQHGPARDSVTRVFYVGATRAREALYICSPEGLMTVSI